MSISLWLVVAFALTGCVQSPFNGRERAMEQARQKEAAQDYRGAVVCYERALDGSPQSADAHFRLGILYDEKLNDPVSAVHHFRRYIDLAPTGPHLKEAQANLKRLEYTLATSLSSGTLISHADAVRLRAENTDLHKQVAALQAAAIQTAAAANAGAQKTGTEAGKAAARDAQHNLPPGTRTYQVQPGDTLASISRKFYHNKSHIRDIADANMISAPDPGKLKPGQTLIIP